MVRRSVEGGSGTVTSEERAQLGRAWIETGIAEHASVAAFARFVLHLMSLGAPPDLLLEAIRAMGEEVEHARLCFGIARELSGLTAGPGPLDLSGVLDLSDDPSEILQAAILEGCFEETISAQCAQVAVSLAEDPTIRSALSRIADDESRHADLSWRFVTWMLQKYPDLIPVAEACFAKGPAAGLTRSLADEEPDFLEKYGHLSSRSRMQVQEAVMRDVITPRVMDLLASRAHVA